MPTPRFKTLHVLVFIADGRRGLVHVSATATPTAAWVWRQVIEATPGWSHATSSAPRPRCGLWLRLPPARQAGINIAMGRQLHQTFVAAGFEPPQMRVDGFACGSRTFAEAFTVLSAETIRAHLPVLVKSGIATEHEVAVDTLAACWRDQVLEMGSLICGHPY